MSVSLEELGEYLATKPLFEVSEVDCIKVIFLLYLYNGAGDVRGARKAFEKLSQEQLCGLTTYIHFETARRESREWRPPPVFQENASKEKQKENGVASAKN